MSSCCALDGERGSTGRGVLASWMDVADAERIASAIAHDLSVPNGRWRAERGTLCSACTVRYIVVEEPRLRLRQVKLDAWFGSGGAKEEPLVVLE